MKFTIPTVPPSLNVVLNMNHWQKTTLKNEWKAYIRSQFLPSGRCTVKMRVKITLHHSRFFDKDNAYGAVKIAVDALRQWLLIVNDTAQWLDLTVEQEKCAHKKRHTTIELNPAEQVSR